MANPPAIGHSLPKGDWLETRELFFTHLLAFLPHLVLGSA